MFNIELLQQHSVSISLLFLTMLSAFFYYRVTIGLFILTCTSAFYADIITFEGLLFPLFIPSLILLTRNHFKHPIITQISHGVCFILCLALALHIIPGFNNLLVLDKVYKSEQSSLFSMYLNFDKPIILLLLLCLVPNLLHKKRNAAHDLTLSWSIIALLAMMIFPLAYCFNLTSFDFNLPSWWWIFVLNNLLITCVVEEAFFRGYIQNRIINKTSPLVGLIATSMLFGVAHFAGGWQYVIVATIAGMVYGSIYLKTGRITFAVGAHFLVNMIHLTFFAYPLKVT